MSPHKTFFSQVNNRLAGLTLIIVATATGLSGCAAPTNPSQAILEVNVTNNPERVNGQPVVAVHPANPSNLVLIATNHVPDSDSQSNAKVSEFHCTAAYSNDGGATWSQSAFPSGDRPFCGDPYLAVDSKGTFFTAFNRLGCPGNPQGGLSAPCSQGRGKLGVARSHDGGRTWSVPVDTPAAVAVTPRLRVDRATDRVYAVGAKDRASAIAVTVSADHGVTWSAPALLPSQPFGNQIAVHDGILATATALAIQDRNVVASDVKFWTSTDDGRTFTSFPVTDSEGKPVPPPVGDVVPNNQTLKSSDPIPFVSADPTARGRFALMIPRGDNLEVYVTGDAGKSWTGPAVIAAAGAAKPWMDFGTQGILGVTWRTLGGDVVNAYSAVSRDGGKTFSPPLQVNRTTHPYGFPGSGGDEWSRILIDGPYAYVTWSDGRGGGAIDAIMARVPLSLYQKLLH